LISDGGADFGGTAAMISLAATGLVIATTMKIASPKAGDSRPAR
jgi:hypothetical protein